MLALMPQSPQLPDLYAPKMSLAVLSSSPVTYAQPPLPNLLPPGPPSAKRPKLSLNTSDIAPTFGKNATSLRLETLSATSPTARNTFRNSHSPQQTSGAKSRKPALTPLSTNVSTEAEPSTPPAPIETKSNTAVSPPSSADSCSSIDSLPSEVPYKLPFNAASILVNGPIPRNVNRRMSFSQTRPLFPTPKKVSFRAPLTEEVKNTKFTLKHSDIESSSSTISSLDLSNSTEETVEKAGTVDEAQEGAALKKASPRTGDKRDSSDEEEEDSDSVPATPVAGRRKRHRQWRWTLGPVSPASPVEQRDEEAGKQFKKEAVSVLDPGKQQEEKQ